MKVKPKKETTEKIFEAMQKHVQPLIDKHLEQYTNESELVQHKLHILANFHGGVLIQIKEAFKDHKDIFKNPSEAFEEFIYGNLELVQTPVVPKKHSN